ncbi:MAG TPA: S1 RNA-binding domain-containing protein [Rhizomicrobium sp.]|nr:S1 RNA-binding domain-containing protein [Rhizomicrobium sp.]
MSIVSERLKKALATGEILSAKIIRKYDRSALVSVDGDLAKLVDTSVAQNQKFKAGAFVDVYVFGIDENKGKAYVSRRNIGEIRKIKYQESFAREAPKISIGATYDGIVCNIVDFGLFVDINGLQGLVHFTQLSWSNQHSNLQSFEIGDHVKVSVLAVNLEKRKIELSIKKLLPDPFQEIVKSYEEDPDRVYQSIRMAIRPYGIFCDIEGRGYEGLLHVSTLLGERMKQIPAQVLEKINNIYRIPVRIISINVGKRRAELEYAGKDINEIMNSWWPDLNEVFEGKIKSIDDTKAVIHVRNKGDAVVFSRNSPEDHFELGFRYTANSLLKFKVVGFDLSLRCPVFELASRGAAFDMRPFDALLENFLTGNSVADLRRRLSTSDPYFVLAKQLQHFSRAKLNRTFDYIYHFGHVTEVSEIRLFGLLHRASIEFKLRRPGFAFGLLACVFDEAVRMRHAGLARGAAQILRKNSKAMMEM